MTVKKKIIIVGDSVTFGHGCIDRVHYYNRNTKKWVGTLASIQNSPPSQYCWPSLLSRQFPNLEVVNLAESGNSNDRMAPNLIDHIVKFDIQNVDLIIFAATFSDRMAVADPQYLNNTRSWIMSMDPALAYKDKNILEANSGYINFLYNEKIGVNRTMMALLASQAVASLVNSKFIFSVPYVDTSASHKLYNKIDSNRIESLHTIDYSGTSNVEFNKTMKATDGHPNEAGHQFYLNNCIIPLLNKLEILC